MIWQAWALLVLIGTLWSYVAFVQKQAAVWSGIATFGFYGVAAVGALELQTKFTTETEIGAAVACAIVATIGMIVAAAAFTGQYGDEDSQDKEDTPGAGAVRRRMEG